MLCKRETSKLQRGKARASILSVLRTAEQAASPQELFSSGSLVKKRDRYPTSLSASSLHHTTSTERGLQDRIFRRPRATRQTGDLAYSNHTGRMRPSPLALLALAASSCVAASELQTQQQVLQHVAAELPLPLEGPATPQTALQGRFIHLTDLHPDPFYLFNSSEDGACHGGLGRDEDRGDRAGWWGTSVR